MNTERENFDSKPPSWWSMISNCSGTEQDRRNQYRFVAWCFAWAVSFIAASWVFKSDIELSGPMVWLLAGVPNIFAILALLSYLRFLRMADEMLQKIQLEGLAWGFGAGVVFVMAYMLLEKAGAPQLETDDLMLVMMMAWCIGQLVGLRRYQ